MRVAAIVCFVLSGVLLLSGINTAVNADAATSGQSASYDLGYYVGAFLPAMVCLILALVLNGKAQRSRPADDDQADDVEQEHAPH